ncbi:MAG: tryptophan--tRNA ligase [Elusimicrobiales bacterium]|nr:tryptophan--tRNA ligase [Elusimicrobiales bacterium]
MDKIIVSGMRPTGRLHLGNYWGALHNYVKLQNEYKCYFFIADLHSLTTSSENTARIYENSILMIADWLSCGVDHKKAVIFRQSDIKEHSELHLVLSMITPLSWVLRNPTFKEQLLELYSRKYKGQEDKAKKAEGHIEKMGNVFDMNEEELNALNSEYANYGFLGYPVLQSADILLYDADYVPVGKDQLAHIEITREIARRFNHMFSTQLLKEPKPLLSETPVLPGLDGKKMSKSYGNTIEIGENGEILNRKVMSMYTDPNKLRASDKGNPDGCVVFAFHKIYNPDYSQREKECREGSIGCVKCKKHLFELLNPVMKEFSDKRNYYIDNKKEIEGIIEEGNKKAKEKASLKMIDVLKEIKIK